MLTEEKYLLVPYNPLIEIKKVIGINIGAYAPEFEYFIKPTIELNYYKNGSEFRLELGDTYHYDALSSTVADLIEFSEASSTW